MALIFWFYLQVNMGITTPDYEVRQLPNGIRIAHKQVIHTKIAHAAFVLDAGSRDEAPYEQGLAHFWEHMAFKGTTSHKAFHICNTLERIGGELNAYTTKEKICFYASVLAPHFKKATDLLTDILFHSIFPEKEIEKERQVILEEMAMYLDSPDDAISDEFDSLIFRNHTLGNNILGTQESVKATSRDAFLAFVAQHLNTEKLVLATVGPMTMDQVMRTVGAQLESKPRSTPANPRTAFSGYVPQTITQEKPITQAHVLMGCPALAYTHPDRLPLVMLTNMLGGPAMNSRLNLAVREKHGLTYAIEAGFTPYGDTGIFSIYYGTEPRQINRVQRLVKQELRKLREKPLGITQMRQVQEQLKGQLAMSEESNLNLCLALGKSLLDAGRMESLPEIFNQIDAIKPAQLADLANQFFNEEGLSTLIYVPEEE